jgi:cellulase (glycosyl hydrolase family 5)
MSLWSLKPGLRRPPILRGLAALSLLLLPGRVGMSSTLRFRIPDVPQTAPVNAVVKDLEFLRVSADVPGGRILDTTGNEVVLKGFNFGGWLMYEDWLLKPGTKAFKLPAGQYQNEPNITRLLDQQYGAGTGRMFFNGIRDNFIVEDDFLQVRRLGGNVVRIPVASWLFADGTGFRYLDQALTWAETSGVYVIIDMHAAPGCQIPATFCLQSGTATGFWTDATAQQQTLSLWRSIAQRYRDRAVVAGYDILSEPAISNDPTLVPSAGTLQDFYKRLITAIRGVDNRHILFVEGNGWALDLSLFQSNWLGTYDPNTAYSLHLYRDEQCPAGADLEGDIAQFVLWQKSYVSRHKRPIYVGELGGTCDEWVASAVDVLLRSDVNIRWATYFTWKTAAKGVSESGKAVHGIVDPTAWLALLSKLTAGQAVTATQFNAGMAALESSNFEPQPGYLTQLERYFDAQP